jgi:hypothetical protein
MRQGLIARRDYKILHRSRLAAGPTEQIERGEYSNFPWESCRGDGNLDGPPFPLLWEKKPDDDGQLLMAFSDGSTKHLDRAEAETAIRNARQR